jgi:hypothetical protein
LILFNSQFLPLRYRNNAENILISSNCSSQSQSKKVRERKRKNSHLNEQDEPVVNDVRKKDDQRSIQNPSPLDDITNSTTAVRQSKRKRRNWLKYSQWTIENQELFCFNYFLQLLFRVHFAAELYLVTSISSSSFSFIKYHFDLKQQETSPHSIQESIVLCVFVILEV